MDTMASPFRPCKHRVYEAENPTLTVATTMVSGTILWKNRQLMLKIKIPPRSEPEKTDAVPLKQDNDDSSVTQFRDWWQEEFEEPADFLEYDAGQLKTAVMLSEMVKDLVWPDFKVGVEGSWVVFRRVKERYFPRKKKDESSQLNDESSK